MKLGTTRAEEQTACDNKRVKPVKTGGMYEVDAEFDVEGEGDGNCVGEAVPACVAETPRLVDGVIVELAVKLVVGDWDGVCE